MRIPPSRYPTSTVWTRLSLGQENYVGLHSSPQLFLESSYASSMCELGVFISKRVKSSATAAARQAKVHRRLYGTPTAYEHSAFKVDPGTPKNRKYLLFPYD